MPVIEFWKSDAPSIRVRATTKEWTILTAPARDFNFPIDGSTVDSDLLAELLERPTVTAKTTHSVELA